jgi:catechol 2,3-dioxygenase-like lactoylglutathione lyase family enzyme
MTLGPIEAVRVFTTNLAKTRRFYAEILGLREVVVSDAIAIFDTGQAKLIVEHVDLPTPRPLDWWVASPRFRSQSRIWRKR